LKRFKGVPASRGISFGTAYVYRKEELRVKAERVDDPDKEVERFKRALSEVKSYLLGLRDKVRVEVGEEEAEIYDALLLILDDESSFVNPTIELITEQGVCAEYAVHKVLEDVACTLEGLESEYMRQRALDIRDVKELIIKNLRGEAEPLARELPEDAVVFAVELGPSDIAGLDKRRLAGIVTEKGGVTSHPAIIARSMGIPAVMGAKGVLQAVKPGIRVIVDGGSGEVVIDPSPAVVERYRLRAIREKEEAALLMEYVELPAVTSDGFKIGVYANVGGKDDVDLAVKYGAEGIGLLRTEFMFADRSSPPAEDELVAEFKYIAERFRDKPVIVRTLDVGCDKPLPYIKLPAEDNPFLGVRGIRVTLRHKDIFKLQLKAILKATVMGDFRIMFPMITVPEELSQARALLEECMGELSSQGVSYRRDVKVGIMVETPSAALLMDLFADLADFFSIGTNDLTQYVMAADRGNAELSALYSPFQPAVLKLIAITVEKAHERGKEVGVCGEMASDPRAIPLLVGLGVDELSMNPMEIPRAKKIIRGMSKDSAEKMAAKVLKAKNVGEVLKILRGSGKV